MTKKVWALRIGNYWPEMCSISMPLIQYWAEKNGWKFETISIRAWPEMPVTYEKLQVSFRGSHATHNLLLDLDLLLRPDFVDPSQWIHPAFVASSYAFDALTMFKPDKYFVRDGRNIGIAGGCVYSTELTHEVWEPAYDLSGQQILESTKRAHIADEFCLSRNLAKYGLKHTGISQDPDRYLVHIGAEGLSAEEKAEKVKQAWNIIDDWSREFPDLAKIF
jgi:hypothetical protein